MVECIALFAMIGNGGQRRAIEGQTLQIATRQQD
jgi:hypothetical protein